ncbi:MAG: endolytic transglycosylase MltG [Nitrospirae bacterium]|nr:endolytic transglycosylase MltG [Nitrospirota bacterium]
MKPWLALGLVGVVLYVAGSVVYHRAMDPLVDETGQRRVTTVDIPEGATFRHVAALLEQEHLIASQWGFLLLGKLTGVDRRVLAGEYALHAGMRPQEILSELLSGHVVLHPITIPEGYTAVQITDLLSQKGLGNPAEFLKLVHDPDFIRTLHLGGVGPAGLASLEGYLFPNTYSFAKRVETKEIVRAMVGELEQVLTPELRARARDLNMTVHQVLTLASVIEKETGSEGERELISAVFHNRLRRHIPLQSDPTVIYGLASFDGNLRKRDLALPSPYNTYRVTGLPPGPIANPGAGSIRAALYPVPTTYLYFVSRNDGTHEFSSTLAEHNRAVDKHQRRPVKRLS